MIIVHFQCKLFNITVIQVYALTGNAEDAEVERLYEDLQDLLELTLPNVSPSFQNHHVWPGSLSSLSINRDVVSWLFVFPISVRFQGKPFNITVMQAYAPTSNAEEAEVEQFYEDLQDLFRTNIQKRCPFHYRGLECKSRKSRNT